MELPSSDYQKPVLECHRNCKCRSDVCTNQVLSRGPLLYLTTYDTVGKGQGLKTNAPIPKSTFVCEYLGELIGKQEAKNRLHRHQNSNYLLTVNEQFSKSLSRHYIDARHYGNLARFINHSCAPNLISVVLRCGSNVPRVGLFAHRHIDEGEELTFSYASNNSSKSNTPCLCGTSECTKYLPFDVMTE